MQGIAIWAFFALGYLAVGVKSEDCWIFSLGSRPLNVAF